MSRNRSPEQRVVMESASNGAEVIDAGISDSVTAGLDPLALNVLARSYSRLFAAAADDREALTQEVCARAWAGRHAFTPSRGTFEQWVFGIVRNTAREAWRKSRRERSLWQRLRSAVVPAPPDLDAVALRYDISAALQRLSRRDQQLIYWRYWEGRRYREIGEALGVDERAARQAARRAVARLGRYLA